MMRLIKFLLGLTAGAAAGVLLAPKSGRELRRQVLGGAAVKLLPPVAEHYPLPEGRHSDHEDAAPLEQPPIAMPDAEAAMATTTLAEEPPAAVVEPVAVVEPIAVDEPVAVVEPIAVDEPAAVVEPVVVDEPAAVVEPVVVDEPAAVIEAAGEDLLARIRETRASVEAELADPFGPARESQADVIATPTAAAAAPIESPPTPKGLYWDPTPRPEVEPEPERSAFEDLWTDEPLASETDLTADVIVIPPPSPVQQWVIESPAVSETPVETPVVQMESPGVKTWEEPAGGEQPVTFVAEPAAAAAADRTDAAGADAPPIAVNVPPAGGDEARLAPAATAAPGGGPLDQAAMRRRIEETRARLKAKAFDAMMSGGSALLRTESGTKAVPQPSDTSLEPEVDSTIDESLSQEDS